jgi:hypothetical protein
MSEITQGGPSSKSINVLVTIDAEALKKSGLPPGASESTPTMINDPTLLSNVFFMICTGSRGIISGQGTDKLNFKANAGDSVAFEGITVDGNSDDAVIIYGIDEKAHQVFNEFRSIQITRTKAVQPASAKSGLPAVVLSRNFLSYQTTVARSGVSEFLIKFALYKLADDGQSQVLVGYYKYDPKITVA